MSAIVTSATVYPMVRSPDTNGGKDKWLVSGPLPLSQGRRKLIFKVRQERT